MADSLIAPRKPRVIDEHVIAELEALHRLSGSSTSSHQASDFQADLHDTLFAVECLPLTRENAVIRAQAVSVFYEPGLADWSDDSPIGLLVKQIVQSLLAH